MDESNSTSSDYLTVESHHGVFPDYISSQSMNSESSNKLDPNSQHMQIYYLIQKELFQEASEILEQITADGMEKGMEYLHIWKFFILVRTRNIPEARMINDKIILKDTIPEFFKLIYQASCAKLLFFEHNLDESHQIFNRLIQEVNISNYKYFQGYLLNQLAQVQNTLGRADEAIESFKDALIIFDQINNDPGILGATNNIGLCYQYKGEYQIALKYYEKARILNNKNYREIIDAILNINIGGIYQEFGMFQKSEAAIKKALEFFEPRGMTPYLIVLYQNLGRIYAQQGDFDTSLIFNKKAIDLLDNQENIVSRVEIMINISDFFIQQKKFQEAEENLREIESYLEKQNLNTGRNIILITYIDLYLEKEERIKAKPYFDELNKNLEDPNINLKYKTAYEYTIANYKLGSQRFKEKSDGLDILNKIIDTKDSNYEIYTKSLMKKCSVLLDEYKATNLDEIVSDIEQVLHILMNFAKQKSLIVIKIQSLLLMTEFETLKGDIKLAQKLFAKAKNIASDNQIDLYSMYIDLRQEELLKLARSENNETLSVSAIKDAGLKNMNNLLHTLLSAKTNFVAKWRDPETDKFLTAVLHPLRYKMVKILVGRGKMLRSELQLLLDVPQSSISRHLKTLEAEAIVVNDFEFIDSKAQSIVEITPYGLKLFQIFEES